MEDRDIILLGMNYRPFHQDKSNRMEGFNSSPASSDLSSADNLYKQFEPRLGLTEQPDQDGQNIGPDLDPKRLQKLTPVVFLKEF